MRICYLIDTWIHFVHFRNFVHFIKMPKVYKMYKVYILLNLYLQPIFGKWYRSGNGITIG